MILKIPPTIFMFEYQLQSPRLRYQNLIFTTILKTRQVHPPLPIPVVMIEMAQSMVTYSLEKKEHPMVRRLDQELHSLLVGQVI